MDSLGFYLFGCVVAFVCALVVASDKESPMGEWQVICLTISSWVGVIALVLVVVIIGLKDSWWRSKK